LIGAPVAAQQNDWIVTVGAGASAGPPYEGSPNTELHPTLSFSAHRADKPYRFTPPDDGGSLDLFASKHFDFGPVLNIREGRSDKDKLAGFSKIGWAAEPGLFADLWATDWLRARVQVRQGIFGHHGAVGDAGVDSSTQASAGTCRLVRASATATPATWRPTSA
jgi:outer membrane scaffolding protein for murein synthesis (MipA/OmpV family)